MGHARKRTGTHGGVRYAAVYRDTPNPDTNTDPFDAPLDDALADDQDLDRALDPWLPRPDHRVLYQTEWMPLPKGERECLATSTAPHPMAYICYLQVLAAEYHQMAAAWEEQTTGTAARVIWRSLRIRSIAQTHPLVWLESTPLMRALRAWEAEADNPELPRRSTPRPARTRYTTLTSTRSRCRPTACRPAISRTRKGDDCDTERRLRTEACTSAPSSRCTSCARSWPLGHAASMGTSRGATSNVRRSTLAPGKRSSGLGPRS